MTAPGARLPLTASRAVSTFGVALLGLMTANLVPLMILALVGGPGMSATSAGLTMTGCLLATAAVSLATARLTEGRGRYLVARVGLLVAAAGFAVAALAPSAPIAVVGILLAGAGCGGAASASGAALAALRDPDRMAGINGLVNRGIVTLVLLIIPALGGGMPSAFGVPALLALLAFLTVPMLPPAPAQAAAGTTSREATRPRVNADAAPATAGTTSSLASRAASRRANLAGLALLLCFGLWALGEDSLWAMAGAMGADQAGITDAQMGMVLSASTAGGLLASLALIWVGRRLGRAVPLAVLLLLGGVLKVLSGQIDDPGLYLATIIAWNTIYSAAFMYVVSTAAGLDSSGRWNAPLQGAYLVGSSFAPVFGAALSEHLGYAGMGWVLGLFSFALLVPVTLIARRSSQIEAAEERAAQATGGEPPARGAGAGAPVAATQHTD
jgi:MFS transporter, DHA1 family, inner membrane transport protein